MTFRTSVHKAWLLSSGVASPGFWRAVVATQIERIEEEQARLVESTSPGADPFDFREAIAERGPIQADTHFLLIAVRHVLRYHAQYLKLTNDQRLIDAEASFNAAIPHVTVLRNVLEHLDEYAVGEGRLQRDGEVADHAAPALHFQSPDDAAAEIELRLADRSVPLKATARATIRLAGLLIQVWNDNFTVDC